MPVSLIALVPTVLEKFVFYGYLAVASVSLVLPTQFVHCCLVTARAFMPASLIVILYTTLEISKFLGQLPVDDDDDNEKSQLNPSIASLRSKQFMVHVVGNQLQAEQSKLLCVLVPVYMSFSGNSCPPSMFLQTQFVTKLINSGRLEAVTLAASRLVVQIEEAASATVWCINE